MARFLRERGLSRGQVPGEMVFVGEKKVESTTINLIDYDHANLTEKDLEDLRDSIHYKNTDTVTWFNICGLHDTELIREIGNSFGLHTLVMEDIVNTGQRPKMEDYDDYLFFGIKMMHYDESKGQILSEQLSMILGETFLFTFQERPGDVFDPIRDRIRKQKGRIRSVGIDYLAYVLLDTIVDNYIFIIERLGEKIEVLETEILDNPTQNVLLKINDYKREINYFRKSVSPAREFMLHLSRLDSGFIRPATGPFLKDLLDHANQAMEVIDTYREMLSDHLNIYNTGINNRLNEIMKVLTIFSAIFIPITFIAGVYGTNFRVLPELHYRYSYFIMWGVFLVISLTMLRFFKRRNWM